MFTTHVTAFRLAIGLACWGGICGACRPRASTVPLGGKHVDEVVAHAPAATLPAVPGETPERDDASQVAEEVEVVEAPAPKSGAQPAPGPAQPPAPGAFTFKPYVAHQSWTRSLDLEFDLKVGPGGDVDMRMVSHQEARFEVLSVTSSGIDRLAIEYPVYTSKLTIMGQTQDSPEELAGKRFVVSFAHGKPDVRDAAGRTPPKKQVDSVNDDAREPLEIEKALRELTELAKRGTGDFSHAGAIALAGGEDDDTKVSKARGNLERLTSGPHGERLAQLQLGYTLTSVLDEQSSIEVSVSGTLSVLDGPARYQTSTLRGPMELRSSAPGGMQGRGSIQVTTSYRY